MEDAPLYLFETLYDGKPLFNSQVDLAQSLLNNSKSGYYVEDIESEDYKRELNKLKAYISQLLSSTVARSLTPVFRHSIGVIIAEKLANTEYDFKEITSKILVSLESKNKRVAGHVGRFPSHSTIEELFQGIAHSEDVLVITARPFDINSNNIKYSLQEFLILDFVQNLANPNRPKKRYRFNFPVKQTGDLFWYGFKKALDQQIARLFYSKKNIEQIYFQSLINSDLYEQLIQRDEYTKDLISKVSESIIQYLNSNSLVTVYIVDEPIFSVPMIILNPNKRQTLVYIVIENDLNVTVVNRLGLEDTVLWKFLVWDRIKTKFSGKAHEFSLQF